MRLRPLALLSTIALTGVLLTACSGDPAPDGTTEPTSTPDSACVLNTQPGPGSDAVQVEGSGLDAKITVPEGTVFDEIERTIVAQGEGDEDRTRRPRLAALSAC